MKKTLKVAIIFIFSASLGLSLAAMQYPSQPATHQPTLIDMLQVKLWRELSFLDGSLTQENLQSAQTVIHEVKGIISQDFSINIMDSQLGILLHSLILKVDYKKAEFLMGLAHYCREAMEKECTLLSLKSDLEPVRIALLSILNIIQSNPQIREVDPGIENKFKEHYKNFEGALRLRSEFEKCTSISFLEFIKPQELAAPAGSEGLELLLPMHGSSGRSTKPAWRPGVIANIIERVDHRVYSWFKSLDYEYLKKMVKTNSKSKSSNTFETIVFHMFSKEIDKLLQIKDTAISKKDEVRITRYGKIRIDGMDIEGAFSWAIREKCLYHRSFSRKDQCPKLSSCNDKCFGPIYVDGKKIEYIVYQSVTK